MKKGYLYIILATFFFSSMEIALKISAGSYNPIQLTFLRFLIGALVLLPLAVREIRKKQISFRFSDWKFFSLTGFICVVVSMILYQLGIVFSKASVVAVLFSCNSVFVILFAYLVLAEKIYRHTILSIVISVAGMLVIINPAHLSGNAAGIVFSIGAAITFALYNVIGRTRSDRYGGITLTCFSFLFGCAEMLIFIAVTHISAAADWFAGVGFPMFANVPILAGIQPSLLPGLIYVGIFVTGLGYTFYFRAMEETSAATASLVFYIKPVLAPIFAFIVLKEPITMQMSIGILLIIIGSFLSFIPGIRLKKASEERKSLSEDI